MFECQNYHTEVAAMIKGTNEVFSDKFSIHFFELKKISKHPKTSREQWLQFINADSREDFEMVQATTNMPTIQKAVKVIYDMSEDTKIREIFDTQYRPEPDGLCGNDDCGQMSAWYMFSAMGFYPVDPVSGNYVFGAPQLPEIVLNLADGKTFTIIAEGLSKEHKYIDSITLNGEPYTKNYISHEDILKGGTLVYKMK